MAFLQTLLIALVRRLPNWVILRIADFMHFCMASIIGLFGYLTWSGEVKHLFTHIIQHGLHSEPVAFFLVGVLAFLAAQMLQFREAQLYCRGLVAVRRYQRGHAPFSI
jgi:hypothetical protein